MVILGMFNYYRHFIKFFAWIAAPLYDGLKKQISDLSLDAKTKARMHGRCSFPDTPETRSAFEKLKDALSQAPVLIHPDFERGFILYIDACKYGVAGTLAQINLEDDKEHPVLYISRRLNAHEQKYTSTELECLGMVWNLNKLAHYVDGAKLTLVTDHSALKWIWDVKSDVNARLFKWSLQLSVLKDNVTIVHRPGLSLRNVDPLSRNPMDEMTSSKPTNFASYHVTLVHLAKEWLDKLWNGYMNSKFFSKIIKDLQTLKMGQSQLKSRQGDTITEVTNPPPPSDPSATQTPHENSDSATTDQANSNATADVSLQEISTSAQDGKIIATDSTFTLIGKALYFSERKQSAL